MNVRSTPAAPSVATRAPQVTHGLALLDEVFEDPIDATEKTFAVGAASSLVNTAFIVVLSAALCVGAPEWMHAALIGCVWGTLALAGLVCSWSRQRLMTAVVVLAWSALAQAALRSLTDLEHNAAWMCVACALAGGWGIGWMLTPWEAETRRPFSTNQAPPSARRSSRWSMWDIGALATFVAATCWLIPRLENQIELLCRVAPTLLGGALVSLLAVEWGWRDHWSLSRLCSIALGLGLLLALCWLSAPAELYQQRMWQWILSGPASVIAAQGVTVLLAMAAVRIDAHLSLCQVHPH